MKVTLEFNLPEEHEELKECQCGPTYRAVLHDLDNYMRTELKHGDHSNPVHLTIEGVRDKLYDLLNDQGVTIYD